jgi:hypothetical protein
LPSESFSFVSTVTWPTRDNYNEAVREAALDVLLSSGPYNAMGVSISLDAIEWHAVDSCEVAFYWATREAVIALVQFDAFGYPRQFERIPG